MRYFFEDFALDTDRRELRRGADAVPMEPQVFDLLLYLIRNRQRLVSKDDLLASVWQGRIVSESALNTRIHLARSVIGDNGEDQRLIKTWPRKGIRFVGAVREDLNPVGVASKQAVVEVAANGEQSTKRPVAPGLHQEVRFCTTSDGVRIAYSAVGHGPPLVKATQWLGHLEHDWHGPIFGPIMRELAAGRSLVRYDGRGTGLSDWDVRDISFEGFVRDLESVVDASGLKRFALLGMSQGGAISIAYAVRHPERVTHLVIYGGYARGRRKRAGPQDLEHVDAMVTLMRQGWGQENPAFRQLWTSLFLPGGTAEQMQSFNELQRISTSPENAVRMRQAMDAIDVGDLLPHIRVPTLVIHCRGDAVAPFEEGRQLAAAIPGARLVALEGGNHCPLQSDPTWGRIFEEVNSFLRPQAAAGLQIVAKG